MFDWTFAMTAEQQVIFSLQRYKELFWYFINCFRVGKIEMLEKIYLMKHGIVITMIL